LPTGENSRRFVLTYCLYLNDRMVYSTEKEGIRFVTSDGKFVPD